MSIQPLPHQRPPRYLTQDEVGRFFASIEDVRDRALFALMYHHGLRVGEVLLLQRGDLDLARGRLLVRRLKGGAWSEQILFGSTGELLRAHLEFVQDHLGHRNIRSTAIYARITDRHREALMRTFERSPWIVQPSASVPSADASAAPAS